MLYVDYRDSIRRRDSSIWSQSSAVLLTVHKEFDNITHRYRMAQKKNETV